MRRRLTAAVVGIVLALAAGACGGSSSSSTDVVTRAAADTTRLPGYQLAGTFTIASPSGVSTIGLSGAFDRAANRAKLITTVQAGGHRVEIPELISKLAVYLESSLLPDGKRLTGGKPWLKLDLSHAAGAAGVSSLPTASDPTQFVDYLRAVTTATGSKGTQGVQGIPTARYSATIDLDRYPPLVAAPERPAVQRSIKMLESAIGSHTLPINVWIDSHGLVRQLSVTFRECVSRAHVGFAMTLDLYDFGAQRTPPIPSDRSVYNLTPIISRALKHAKLGCAH